MKSIFKKNIIRWSKKTRNLTILGILSIGSSFGVISSAASCGLKEYDVSLIVDSGVITDQSFNQSSWEGIKDYFTGGKTGSIANFRPNSSDKASFQRTYDVVGSRMQNKKIVILSGFLNQSIGDIVNYATSHYNKGLPYQDQTKYVGIDFNESGLPTTPNFAGITFNCVQSGFLAAIWTGIYFNISAGTHDTKIGYYSLPATSDVLKVASFGGLPIVSVTGYMDGYLLGVNYFNNHKDDLKTESKIWDSTQLLGKSPRSISMIYKDGDRPSKSDFSMGFNPDNQAAIGLINYYYGEGANIIFPVAGPQTQLALNVADPSKYKWVYGVDVDQSLVSQYQYGQDRILGSAIKNIRSAVESEVSSIYSSEPFVSKSFSLKDSSAKYVDFIPNEKTYGGVKLNGTTIDSLIRGTNFWQFATTNPYLLDKVTDTYRGETTAPVGVPWYLEYDKSYGRLWA